MKTKAIALIVTLLLVFGIVVWFSPKDAALPRTVVVGSGAYAHNQQKMTEYITPVMATQETAQATGYIPQTATEIPVRPVQAALQPPNTTLVAITLKGFVPAEVIIPVGSAVLWNNTVNRPAIVQDYKGVFRAKLGYGQNFTHVFDTEGTYEYRDAIINWRGKVVVQP